ncbi:hypothetical protein G9A89_015553 [Geosiphon pyriformis]|nr:hypothetical protein G9A89_015553 [Geosiphon pyriformis]
MPKEPSVKTIKALGKPLGKIDFLGQDENDDAFLDVPLVFPPPLKNLVTVSVRKFFAMNIGLNKVAGKSSQKKLAVVRKLFSKVNGFGRASTSSKFSGIIHVFFTSKASLAQMTEKAKAANILVNTDLKKLTGHSDQAVVVKKIPVGTSAETVQAALSEFGLCCVNQNTIGRAMTEDCTNAYDIWNFIGSVGGKHVLLIDTLLHMPGPDVLLFVLTLLS